MIASPLHTAFNQKMPRPRCCCSTSAHTGSARERVEFHKRFQQATDAICEIKLRRLLQPKQEGKEPEKG